MLEIIQYIFSDFWRWLGAFLMLAVVTAGFAELLNSVRGK